MRVSPLCLYVASFSPKTSKMLSENIVADNHRGAMNFGEAWKAFLGECSKETSFQMMDFFYEQGGNFIDT